MIETITAEQQHYFDKLIDKYCHEITKFKPMDEQKTIDAIIAMSEYIGIKGTPKIVFADDPEEACRMAAEHLKKPLSAVKEEYYLALWWRYWVCYYEFAEYIGVKFDKKILKLFRDFIENVYFSVPYDDIWFVARNPVEAFYNDKKELHRDGGSCIEFIGGNLKMYYLNGTPCPEWLVMTPSSQLDIQDFLKEKNAAVKAEFVRKYGIDRMVELGKLVDSYDRYNTEYFTNPHVQASKYQLIDMGAVHGLPYAPYVKMINQTTGMFHLESVSPDCKNLPEALAFAEGDDDIEQYDIIDIR